MHNCNFDDFNPHLPYQFTVLEARLSDALDELEKLDANLLLMPNITMHHTFDRLNRDLAIAHPVNLTAQKLVQDGHSQAYILGTKYTMTSSYMKDSFKSKGIEVLEPSADQQKLIDDFRSLVYDNVETHIDIKAFKDCMAELQTKHPIILACTELSVLDLGGIDGVYDMARLQVEYVIDQLR